MTQLAKTRSLPHWEGPGSEVLTALARATARTGADPIARRLLEIRSWMADEFRDLEADLRENSLAQGTLADRAAAHLLAAPGKRIRPLCVFLAARTGETADTQEVTALAAACELVHTATLLHDDVIDEGTERRGRPAARMVFGNSASVLGGDHLLIQALQRVMATGRNELLSSLLRVIDAMIRAEALQLESRGRFEPDPERYNTIVQGKTALLFRWGMEAGATACNAGPVVENALGDAGEALGRAFQLTDDVLDLRGTPQTLGKNTMADLREGKLTWPLIVACQRDPGLVDALRAVTLTPERFHGPTGLGKLRDRILATGTLEASQAEAMGAARSALDRLSAVPRGRVHDALRAVVHAAIARVA